MNSSKGKILYIGNFSGPKGNAAGIRVLGNGYLFRKLGYEVSFLGLSKEKDSFRDIDFEGFRYNHLPYPNGMKDWAEINKRKKKVIEIIEKEDPNAVVFYGNVSNSLLTLILANYCKRKSIFVIHDVVDWLSASSGNVLRRIVKKIDTEFHKRYVNARGDGVIAISERLGAYYKKKDILVAVIPPLSIENTPPEKSAKNFRRKNVTFVYAGFPFDAQNGSRDPATFKDRLDFAIDLYLKIQNKNNVFKIYGLTKESYLAIVDRHRAALSKCNSVVFYGSVDNEIVRKEVKNSDYMLLYRESSKTTEFGFPSKVSEAISLGTAVVTTNTSDLNKYINNLKNGIILDFDPNVALVEFEKYFQHKNEASLNIEVDTSTFSPSNFVSDAMCFFLKMGLSE